ncbi:MAG: PUR family DNA/RNA-binding protein [Bacteroidales bacterium]|nr:PUR family DNA/RNA-binding protein [Bacteroidales bacterium]MBN2748743.1 PUR family DNA/RNA-binding protein [Bacteroidales bacterium]
MDGFDNLDGIENTDKDDIYSKVVRAGKRTYFFDVKATRRNDFYLTITESKKRVGRDGKFFFEKHKIFLYKEDFEKFAEGLSEVVDYIRARQLEMPEETYADNEDIGEMEAELSNLSFEDLGSK